MNADERQLIMDLFDRMGAVRLPDKDRDAEQVILSRVRQMPDASYMLVQQVLIQEHALQQATMRIADLEDQMREASRGAPASRSGGSFLGGIAGGAGLSSVPPVGRASATGRPGYEDAPTASPWRQPSSQQTQPAPQMQAGPSGGGFGGFLRSAMTTASGVAGGMLMGDALRGLMHGGSGEHPAAAQSALPYDDQSAADAAQDAAQDAEDDNNSSWAGGGDDGGSTDV